VARRRKGRAARNILAGGKVESCMGREREKETVLQKEVYV
jgi:hypothetical protein